MDKNLEQRLATIEGHIEQFRHMLEKMGKDVKRPFKAIRDGYYEAALTNAGSIIEDMLRDIWRREKISGKESKKTIEQLFAVIKNQVEIDRLVEDYIRDIQLTRNRAAHGESIVAEDSIETLRKLSTILNWYFNHYLPGKGHHEDSTGNSRGLRAAAVPSGAVRSRPARRHTAGIGIAAFAVAVCVAASAYYFQEDLQRLLRQRTETASGTAGDQAPTRDIGTILKALSKKYEQQQEREQVQTPDDPWTSRPLSMSIPGFAFVGDIKDRQETEQLIIAGLTQALHRDGRVKLVEREKLLDLLAELQISTSDIADQDMALVMLGRLMGARLISAGKIMRLKDDTTLDLRVFETDTSRIVVSLQEELNNAATDRAVESLAQRLAGEIRKLYALKGKVVKLKEQEVLLNLGSDAGVTLDAMFSVLSEGSPVQARGRIIGYDGRKIGSVRVAGLQPKMCSALIMEQTEPFKEGMYVMEMDERSAR